MKACIQLCCASGLIKILFSALFNWLMLVSFISLQCTACSVTASGAEGEAGETAGRPGRPAQSQRGETKGAAETQGGGDGEEEERGRGGSQVCLEQIVPDASLQSAFVSFHFQQNVCSL